MHRSRHERYANTISTISSESRLSNVSLRVVCVFLEDKSCRRFAGGIVTCDSRCFDIMGEFRRVE